MTPPPIDDAGQSMAPFSIDAADDARLDELTVIIEGRPLSRRIRRHQLAVTTAVLVGTILACLGAVPALVLGVPRPPQATAAPAATCTQIVETAPRYAARVADVQEVTRAPSPIRQRAPRSTGSR